MARQQKKHTVTDRDNALAMLAASSGDVVKTAQQLGVPTKTLETWAKGGGPREKATNTPSEGVNKAVVLADTLDGVASKLAEALAGKIAAANPEQATTAITLNKLWRLLSRANPSGSCAQIKPSWSRVRTRKVSGTRLPQFQTLLMHSTLS
jgi:hypothetical protein